jgi:hypothetical protein
MSFSKTIALGSLGSLVVSESAGVAQLQLSVGDAIGGGQAAGVATASASVQAQVSAKQLIDLGFALAEAKFPSAASLIAAAQAAVDAELATL